MRSLLFLLLHVLNCVSCGVINCTGEAKCLAKTYHCKHGEDCIILCIGKHSCQGSIMHCPSGAYNCVVNSTAKCATCGATLNASEINGGNMTVTAVERGPHFAHIYCPVNGKCNLHAFDSKYAFAKSTIMSEHATKLNIDIDIGNAALQESNIYCPVNGGQGDCVINIHNKPYYHNGLIDTNIYSASSWRGVTITCEDDKGCGDVTMHCTRDYNISCTSTDNKYNECDDTNSGCSTTNTESGIEFVDVIIFSIWMSAFCCIAMIILCLYCNRLKKKTNAAKCLEMSGSNTATNNEYLALSE